jgi:CheY-like chemotaxis protein
MSAEETTRGKVLLVDDEDPIRNLVRILLEEEGYSIMEARDGVEAISIAVAQQPDTVVLDFFMPRLDGEGTVEILRATVPGVRIVAFSAVLQAAPPWADAFLPKSSIGEIAPLLAERMN